MSFGSFISRVIQFIKSGGPVIIGVMIAGNLLFFLNDDSLYGTFYAAGQKVKTGSRLYDRINDVLELETNGGKPDSNGIRTTFHSYHLESHYYFELKAEGRDSQQVISKINGIRNALNKDTLIASYFTGPFSDLKKLDLLTTQRLESIGQQQAEGGSVQLGYMEASLLHQQFDIRHYLRDLEKEFEIYPFLETDVRVVNNSIARSIARINLICFILGLFVSVTIREVIKR